MRLITVFLLLQSLLLAGQIPLGGITGSNASGPATSTKFCIQGAASNVATCTWNVALVSGETAVCLVSLESVSGTITSFVDSGGNNLTSNGALNRGITLSSQYFYRTSTGSITTETVTATVSPVTILFCGAYTGGSGTPDGAVGFTDCTTSNTAPCSATSITAHSTPATTTAIAFCNSIEDAGPPIITIDAAYTVLGGNSGTGSTASGYRKLTTSGASNATFTDNNGGAEINLTCAAWQ